MQIMQVEAVTQSRALSRSTVAALVSSVLIVVGVFVIFSSHEQPPSFSSSTDLSYTEAVGTELSTHATHMVEIPVGGPGSGTPDKDGEFVQGNDALVRFHLSHAIPYDPTYCVAQANCKNEYNPLVDLGLVPWRKECMCQMNVQTAEEKCGAWDKCAGVVCEHRRLSKHDVLTICYARSKMTSASNADKWGFVKKNGPAPTTAVPTAAPTTAAPTRPPSPPITRAPTPPVSKFVCSSTGSGDVEIENGCACVDRLNKLLHQEWQCGTLNKNFDVKRWFRSMGTPSGSSGQACYYAQAIQQHVGGSNTISCDAAHHVDALKMGNCEDDLEKLNAFVQPTDYVCENNQCIESRMTSVGVKLSSCQTICGPEAPKPTCVDDSCHGFPLSAGLCKSICGKGVLKYKCINNKCVAHDQGTDYANCESLCS